MKLRTTVGTALAAAAGVLAMTAAPAMAAAPAPAAAAARVHSSISGAIYNSYASYRWAGVTVHEVHTNRLPVLSGVVSPNKRGERVVTEVQVFFGGRWQTALNAQSWVLNSASQYGVEYIHAREGYVFRSEAIYNGDAHAYASSTGWKYWTVTA
jgi:hypothetical protein